MKRLKILAIVSILILLLTPMAMAAGQWSPLFTKKQPGGIFGVIDTSKTVGDIWYVDSGIGTDGAGYGQSPQSPTATLDYVIALTTADNGDVIYVAPGHAETLTGADGVDIDKAGLRIVGLGEGANKPVFTFGHADAEFVIGAANVTVEGIRFLAGITAVTMGISVEAGGDNFTLKDCVFPEPTTSSFEFVDVIDLASGADSVHIINCTVFSADATGAAHFVEAGNGVNNDLQLIDNYVYGEFSVAAVWSDTIDLEVLISGGSITNLTNGQHAIEFTTTALGMIKDILVRTDAQGTAVDPGSMTMSNVLWDADATADSTAFPVVLSTAGVGSIGTVNSTTTDSLHGKIGTDTEMADASLYDLNVADQVDLDAILVDTTAIEDMSIRSVSKSLTPIATGDLFAVAGGPIRIIEIIGVVTDTVETQANSIKLLVDPTAPATDTDICAALEINADAIGTVYTITGTYANAMVATTLGVVAGLATEIIVPIGMIELNGTASNTGTIVWYIRYMPLGPGVTVTAQ